jgi:hypothetical protein
MYRDSRRPTRWLGCKLATVFVVVGSSAALAGPLAYLSNLDDASVTVVDTGQDVRRAGAHRRLVEVRADRGRKP